MRTFAWPDYQERLPASELPLPACLPLPQVFSLKLDTHSGSSTGTGGAGADANAPTPTAWGGVQSLCRALSVIAGGSLDVVVVGTSADVPTVLAAGNQPPQQQQNVHKTAPAPQGSEHCPRQQVNLSGRRYTELHWLPRQDDGTAALLARYSHCSNSADHHSTEAVQLTLRVTGASRSPSSSHHLKSAGMWPFAGWAGMRMVCSTSLDSSHNDSLLPAYAA
jgi:hypothetical protein